LSNSSDIPPGLQEIFEAAGPVIRFRLVRDVLGHDESWIQTAHLGLELPRLPEVETLLAAQELDGSWGGAMCRTEDSALSTEYAVLRLCELGLESCAAVETCLVKALLPTLANPELIWEFASLAADEATRSAARHIVRDKALHLICRATREHDALLKPFLETLLVEWEYFLSHTGKKTSSKSPVEIPPPTAGGYAAVCWYPWSDDDFERVRAIVKRLIIHAEEALDDPRPASPLYAGLAFALRDRVEYWARPDLLLHDLELSARFGATRDHAVSRWLLDELEARQDADGRFRFDAPEPFESWWYFPLEKSATDDYSVEWSFRAELIFRLLQFDL
jgi:hypothetical protein